jgi:hypothetical protein
MMSGRAPLGVALEFDLERVVGAPPEFVHHWWLEAGPSFETQVRSGVRQERTRSDPYHLTIRRWAASGRRSVYVESRVEVESLHVWTCRKVSTVDGVPLTEESVRYTVSPVADGTRFRLAFSITSPSRIRRGLLQLSGRRIREHRIGEVDDAVRRLLAERARDRA